MQEHGGLDWSQMLEMGNFPAEIYDFSVNVNPFGPCVGVQEVLAKVDPGVYPDRSSHYLTQRLAEANRVGQDEIIIGNGTAELIWLAAHAWLHGCRAVIFSPTFGEYARAARAVGAEVILFSAESPDFYWDIDKGIPWLKRHKPALVFLCNPNNPTGVYLTDEEVREIAKGVEPGILVLDEAYRTFVTGQPFSPPPAENVLVLHSMTKDFALAGLRLGYALGRSEYIAALREYQPPWSVNSLAQAAGLAALSDLDHLRASCEETRRLSAALRAGLLKAGVHVLPSQAPYCLIDVKNLGGAKHVYDQLLKHGIQVRDCTSFGLPMYIRLGTRRLEENRRLLDTWTELFGNYSVE